LQAHKPTIHAYLLKDKRHTFGRVTHNARMDKRTVGQRIRDLRVARKLTQEQLAKAIGIKQGSLTQLETGKSKAPASKTLTKLARLFEVDPEWLMTGRGPQHPVSSLGDEESELVLLYRSLSTEGRAYVLGRARTLHQDEFERRDHPEAGKPPGTHSTARKAGRH
jgi:transcriptional regulator with XRE-family HTH domain